jgi:hypothetical protein
VWANSTDAARQCQDRPRHFFQQQPSDSRACHVEHVSAPKVLADVVESTIGAIFVDSSSSNHACGQSSTGRRELAAGRSDCCWVAAWAAVWQLLILTGVK